MRFAANNKKQRQVNKNKNKTNKQPAKPVSGKIIEFSRICNVLIFFFLELSRIMICNLVIYMFDIGLHEVL